jgi:hypothetical protein
MAKGVKVAGKRVAKVLDEQIGEQAVEGQQTQVPVGNDKASALTKEQARMMQPAACRTYVRKRLATEFPEIVDGFVKEAKKGSCNHIKQAIELLKPIRKGAPRRKGSAQRLLEKLSRDKCRDAARL